MATTECNFPQLAPGGIDCSGIGSCVFDNATSAYLCVCQKGIQAVGDFNFQPWDCDVDHDIVVILWVILSFCAVPVIFASAYEAFQLFKNAKNTNKSLNFSVLRVLVLCFISSSTCFALGMIKAIPEEPELLGGNVFVSILFAISGFTYWAAVILFIEKLWSIVLAQTETGMLKVWSLGVPRNIMIFLILVTFVLTPLLCHVDPVNSLDYTRIYFLGISALIYVGGGTVIYYARTVRRSIVEVFGGSQDSRSNSGAGSNPGREKIMQSMFVLKDRLDSFIYWAAISTIQAVPLTVIALWPFMLRRVGYCIPILSSPAYLTMLGVIAILTAASGGERRWPRFVPMVGADFNLSSAFLRGDSKTTMGGSKTESVSEMIGSTEA